MRYLVVGGITIPAHGSHTLVQTYDRETARSDYRMADFSLRRQTAAGGPKIQTTVRGTGIVPAALEALDFDATLELRCIAPIGIKSASPNIALPTARRSDAGHVPVGRAFVGDRIVWTPVTMNVDTAELTPVTDADVYEALYLPQITVFATLGQGSFERGGTFRWTLTAREQ